jgi:hypothetical protein
MASTANGARNGLIGRDYTKGPNYRTRADYGDALLIFFVLVWVAFVLLVLTFLIRVWWDGVARFLDWLGRVSRVKFHALVLFGLGASRPRAEPVCLASHQGQRLGLFLSAMSQLMKGAQIFL